MAIHLTPKQGARILTFGIPHQVLFVIQSYYHRSFGAGDYRYVRRQRNGE